MAEGTPRTTPVAEDGDAAESRGYHHGDLRAALITAGLEMTRSDGPSALSLREATRRAGVTPAAAYRHFRDRAALLAALGQEIQQRIAAVSYTHIRDQETKVSLTYPHLIL